MANDAHSAATTVRSRRPAGVLVFAPAPLLTITIERRGEDPDVHLHAGGQGFWLARMIHALGVPVTLCGSFGGETGAVVRMLIEQEGVTVRAVETDADNVAYVHDRRGGHRTVLAEMPTAPLSRQDLDSLYNAALVEGLTSDVCVLGGPPTSNQLPADVYRRLAADLRANGKTVIADLSGELLTATIEGGVSVLKISDEQLVHDGFVSDTGHDQLLAAMHRLRASGADAVVVSRADQPVLASSDIEVMMASAPAVEPLDERGGGDALTAGIAAGLARGQDFSTALRLGVAAGRLNVTRRGLATGKMEDIERMAQHVQLQAISGMPEPATTSVDDLVRLQVRR
jgi:1-phosphofructokinase